MTYAALKKYLQLIMSCYWATCPFHKPYSPVPYSHLCQSSISFPRLFCIFQPTDSYCWRWLTCIKCIYLFAPDVSNSSNCVIMSVARQTISYEHNCNQIQKEGYLSFSLLTLFFLDLCGLLGMCSSTAIHLFEFHLLLRALWKEKKYRKNL